MSARDLEDLGIHVVGGSSANVKTRCPNCGQTGKRSHPNDKSLSVNPSTGMFRCHYCGWKGKAGGGGDAIHRPIAYKQPDPLLYPGLSAKAAAFFAERRISPDVVARRKITELDRAIAFPYFRDGKLINVKRRWPNKKFALSEGCELIFYGLDDCAQTEQITIVEGEMDLLALETAGIVAGLSVPNGGEVGEMGYLASGEDVFARCHTIILAVDNDAVGQKLEAELARRIGKEKCWRVRFPEGCKDANDVLMKLGQTELRRVIGEAEPYPVEGLHDASDFFELALALLEQTQDAAISTGWRALDDHYRVLPGELTVVTGVPGSGKSEFLDALMVNLAQYAQWTFAVHSPENITEEHYLKLAAKYLSMPYLDGPTAKMRRHNLERFDAWVHGKLFFLTPEHASIETLIGLARTCVFRYGISGLVIDPWNRLDQSRDAGALLTEHVRDALAALSAFAKLNGLHIWLMAHPKKPGPANGETWVPTPYDISDSAHFFNMADNCLAISREKDPNDPVAIHIQKVRRRRVGQKGVVHLHYDRVTGRYRDIR